MCIIRSRRHDEEHHNRHHTELYTPAYTGVPGTGDAVDGDESLNGDSGDTGPVLNNGMREAWEGEKDRDGSNA